MDAVLPGVDTAAAELSQHGGEKAALAIKTTDTVHKTAVADRDGWCVGGMAKGAGMLAPGLATMLVVLTTDADLDAAELDKTLRGATRTTFDRVDSDGCMSTNDMVLLLASGASGVSPSPDEFADAVHAVCADLARRLVGDAEGASKDIRIEVVDAATEDEAVDVARTIARSNLFKCAVHGEDPNWGRVLSAIGTTDAAFEPDRLGVAINGVWVCRDGCVGEDRELVDMRYRQVDVTADLAAGDESAVVWTNDLTADYVHENSAYSLRPCSTRTRAHRARQGRRPSIEATALAHPGTTGKDRRHQVRWQRHGRRRPQGRLRPGRRLPAPRRTASRRRARRRTADQRPAGPARSGQRVQGGPARDHPRDDGRRAHGARRPGAA